MGHVLYCENMTSRVHKQILRRSSALPIAVACKLGTVLRTSNSLSARAARFGGSSFRGTRRIGPHFDRLKDHNQRY